jgi:ATP-dependent Clp protease ATP-binding subunit ClpB
MDMQFSEAALQALKDAMTLAEDSNNAQLLPIHLATVILNQQAAATLNTKSTKSPMSDQSRSLFYQLVERLHGDPQLLQRNLTAAISRLPRQYPPPEQVTMATTFTRVLRSAHELQKTQNDKFIALDHFIVALSKVPDVHNALQQAKVQVVDIDSINITVKELQTSVQAESDKLEEINVDCLVDTTALAKAHEFNPTIGRDDEIRRLITILSRRTVNNAILLGEGGVGKTSIVNGLAMRIVDGDVPSNFERYRILSLDVPSLVSGGKFQDKFEEKMREVLKTIEESETPTCLFIDDLHLLMGVANGKEVKDGGDDLLRSILFKRQLHHCIAATTPTDYQTYAERNPTLKEQFVLIPVKPPGVRETISILRSLKSRYETRHGVAIADDALVEAATLAGEYFQYLPSKSLPQSAIDLVDETAALVAVTRDSEPEELSAMERKSRQLRTEISGLERDKSSARHVEEIRLELSNLEEMLRPLRQTYGKLSSIKIDLSQKMSKVDNYKTILAEAKQKGDHVRAADFQYYAIPEMQKLVDKAKQDKEAAEADLLDRIQDPATKLFFSDLVGPAQVRQMVCNLTGESQNQVSLASVRRDSAVEGKIKEVSASERRYTPLGDGGVDIPPTSGPAPDNRMEDGDLMDELQNDKTQSVLKDPSRKVLEGEVKAKQVQPGLIVERDSRFDLRELEKTLRVEPESHTTKHPRGFEDPSRADSAGPSTPSLPEGDSEGPKGNSDDKSKGRQFWRQQKLSKFFKSK